MNLEALRGAILNEHDYGVIAGQEDLVVRTCDLGRKVVSERDLRPAADQLDLAGFFQPAIEIRDQAVGIQTVAMITVSTLTGNRLGKRVRANSISELSPSDRSGVERNHL